MHSDLLVCEIESRKTEKKRKREKRLTRSDVNGCGGKRKEEIRELDTEDEREGRRKVE